MLKNKINIKFITILPPKATYIYILLAITIGFKDSYPGEDIQDGRGVRCGDHLPSHKYIRNTSTCGTTPTEHLLNAGRRPQTSQKAQEQLIKSPQST